MTAGPPAPTGPTLPGEGGPPAEEPAPLVEPTETWWDEVLPVYAALAIPGTLRRGYTLPEVDAMPVPMVGALLRLGPRPSTLEEQAHDMLRRRMEAERLGLPPPEW